MRFLLFLFLFSKLFSSPFKDQLEKLGDCSEGYCVVHNVFNPEDLNKFDQIDIRKKAFFDHFGTTADLETRLEGFFSEIGENSKNLAKWAARKITIIANEIIEASEREAAWFHLHASIPTVEYDLPRWHMDGLYFRCPKEYCSYKFVTTLKGPSTLFYPADASLRKIFQTHYGEREFLSEVCPTIHAFSPLPGEGVFFIGSDWDRAAVHSEPPIHEMRLFFSVLPCDKNMLAELKKKIVKINERH